VTRAGGTAEVAVAKTNQQDPGPGDFSTGNTCSAPVVPAPALTEASSRYARMSPNLVAPQQIAPEARMSPSLPTSQPQTYHTSLIGFRFSVDEIIMQTQP
jgi:hypothetical protein